MAYYNNYNQNNQDTDVKQVAKYNDASLSVMRLNNHWIAAEESVKAGRLDKWKIVLDSVWRELYPNISRLKKTNPKEGTALVTRFNKIQEKIAKSKSNAELHFFLSKKHEFLRDLQDVSGMGNVYVDEDDDAFE